MPKVKRYDLDQGRGYDAGGAKLVEVEFGDWIHADDWDTLYALAKEMAGAFGNKSQDGCSCEGCTQIRKWEAFNDL